jgi:hypothetical protein
MMAKYGRGTHVRCQECDQKIFIEEIEVTVRDGKRCVELACKMGHRHVYDEDALDMRGGPPG